MLSPSLHLDFTTPAGRRAARRYLQITRASVGSEWTSARILRPDVPANWARFDHDPVTRAGRLLIEKESKNLALWSKDLTNAVWGKENVSVDPYATGKYPNAFTLTDDAVNDVHGILRQVFSDQNGVPSGQRWAIKAGTKTKARVVFGADISNAYRDVDLTDGSMIDENNARITNGALKFVDVGDGWWEFEFTHDGANTANPLTVANIRIAILNDDGSVAYAGDGTGTIHVAVPQGEENMHAMSSHMPTEGSEVTRLRDDIRISEANVDAAFNGFAEGTIIVEIESRGVSQGPSNRILSRGGTGALAYRNASEALTQINSFDGTTSLISHAASEVRKFAIAWSGNTRSQCANGEAVDAGAWDGTWGAGDLALGDQNWDGWFYRLTGYPGRLSDTQLSAVTAL